MRQTRALKFLDGIRSGLKATGSLSYECGELFAFKKNQLVARWLPDHYISRSQRDADGIFFANARKNIALLERVVRTAVERECEGAVAVLGEPARIGEKCSEPHVPAFRYCTPCQIRHYLEHALVNTGDLCR